MLFTICETSIIIPFLLVSLYMELRQIENIRGEKMSYVVTSKVKSLIKKHKMNTAGDFVGGLNKELEHLVTRAASRAKTNGRKTVRAGDL